MSIYFDIALVVFWSFTLGYLVGSWRAARRTRPVPVVDPAEREQNIREGMDRHKAALAAAQERNPDLVSLGVSMGIYPEGTVRKNGRLTIPASAWREPTP